MQDFHTRADASPVVDDTAEKLTARVVDEIITRESAQTTGRSPGRVRKRRVWLPLALFLATCFSTFWVGACRWFPIISIWVSLWSQESWPEGLLLTRQLVMAHWQDGLIYMVCVLAILLAHEFGHFFATVIYRIPASLPYVIPMPLLPIGTFGAVIGMDGRQADRKQIFDIGLAGPLAGLVLAVPIVIWGTMQLDFTQPAYGPYGVNPPLLIRLLLDWIQPPGYAPGKAIAMSQLNPFFMAGWVGLLITGLNMMPVSQLDGGHVIYALFGKRSRWIARSFMVVALSYLAYTLYATQQAQWILMLGLILFVGVDHPPTRDDSVPLGWFRYGLGLVSLLIPMFCFAVNALHLEPT